jgi:hypothetical protein
MEGPETDHLGLVAPTVDASRKIEGDHADHEQCDEHKHALPPRCSPERTMWIQQRTKDRSRRPSPDFRPAAASPGTYFIVPRRSGQRDMESRPKRTKFQPASVFAIAERHREQESRSKRLAIESHKPPVICATQSRQAFTARRDRPRAVRDKGKCAPRA